MTLEHLDTLLAFAAVMLLLSLVITTLMQAVVAALNLRGRNLAWGVERLLRRAGIDEKLAETLARKALESESSLPGDNFKWLRRAKVIGSTELMLVLEKLCENAKPTDDEEKPPKGSNLTRKEKEALEGILGTDPEAARQAEEYAKKLGEQFEKLFPKEADKLAAAVGSLKQDASTLAATVETWFDRIMTRTTDRFVAHTRFWTIGLSLALAVAFQIDSVDLLRQLSSDAQLRASIVQAADQTVAQADQILNATPLATEALQGLATEFDSLDFSDVPPDLVSRAQGTGWARTTFTADQGVDSVLARYETRFDSLVQRRLPELGNQFTALRAQLSGTGLLELPDKWEPWTRPWGILLTAILLSLGAPFWFKALRSMVALRPVLAGKTDPDKNGVAT